MPRGRKKKELNPDIKPELEPKPVVKPVESLKLLAWFYGRDEEGNRTKIRFESEGMTLEEAVNNLEFPKGINALVNLEISRGEKVAKVALAPHDARYILQDKDWKILGESFRNL